MIISFVIRIPSDSKMFVVTEHLEDESGSLEVSCEKKWNIYAKHALCGNLRFEDMIAPNHHLHPSLSPPAAFITWILRTSARNIALLVDGQTTLGGQKIQVNQLGWLQHYDFCSYMIFMDYSSNKKLIYQTS